MPNPTRKFVDCRDVPSEKNCSLMIAGTEEEVMQIAVRHAVEDHGHEDTPALRAQIRGMLKDEMPAKPAAAAAARRTAPPPERAG
jgi:predicted small metal-binding protein